MFFTNLTMAMTAIIAGRAVCRQTRRIIPHRQVFRGATFDEIASIGFIYFIRLSHELDLFVLGLARI